MSSDQQIGSGFAAPGMKPLDETVWQAWLAKGRAKDNRNRAALSAAVRYVVTAVLLLVSVVWSSAAPYDVMARFVVTAGAMFMMLQAFRSSNHAIFALFGAIALLYNPVVPAFAFAGAWQRAFVVGSAFLFITSFYWQSKGLVRNA